MATITITGASDDLIEVEGDIYEEFSAYDPDESAAIVVSDGTLIGVQYDSDGIWRFTRRIAGTAEFSKIEGDAAAETNDRVTLTGDIKWVLFADSAQVAK